MVLKNLEGVKFPNYGKTTEKEAKNFLRNSKKEMVKLRNRKNLVNFLIEGRGRAYPWNHEDRITKIITWNVRGLNGPNRKIF